MSKKIVVFIVILLIIVMIKPLQIHAGTYDRFYFEKRGEIVWEVPTQKKIVALTFDDGPDREFTPIIAGLLKKYKAKGTFFVIGENLKTNNDIAQDLLKNGHEIANHSYSHRKFSTLNEFQIREELNSTEELITSIQQKPLKLMRPPTGHFDKRVVDIFNNMNYITILWGWNQDTRDWAETNGQAIAARVIKNLKNGDIIIMHDSGGDRASTIQTLEIILPKLQELGYECVTMTELLKEHPKFSKQLQDYDKKNLQLTK